MNIHVSGELFHDTDIGLHIGRHINAFPEGGHEACGGTGGADGENGRRTGNML